MIYRMQFKSQKKKIWNQKVLVDSSFEWMKWCSSVYKRNIYKNSSKAFIERKKKKKKKKKREKNSTERKRWTSDCILNIVVVVDIYFCLLRIARTATHRIKIKIKRI